LASPWVFLILVLLMVMKRQFALTKSV